MRKFKDITLGDHFVHKGRKYMKVSDCGANASDDGVLHAFQLLEEIDDNHWSIEPEETYPQREFKYVAWEDHFSYKGKEYVKKGTYLAALDGQTQLEQFDLDTVVSDVVAPPEPKLPEGTRFRDVEVDQEFMYEGKKYFKRDDGSAHPALPGLMPKVDFGGIDLVEPVDPPTPSDGLEEFLRSRAKPEGPTFEKLPLYRVFIHEGQLCVKTGYSVVHKLGEASSLSRDAQVTPIPTQEITS